MKVYLLQGSTGGSLMLLLIGLALIIAVFFLFREINLWYFKINESIELKKETNRLLQILVSQNTDRENSKSSIPSTPYTGPITDLNDPKALQDLLKKFENK
jgi:hypothetical protein